MNQTSEANTPPPGLHPLYHWNRLPLFLRILISMLAGALIGAALGPKAEPLAIPSNMILRLLGALASPLILIAVVHVLLNTELKGKMAWRMAWLLFLNTTVAIGIGLLVANVIRPGERAVLKPQEEAEEKDPAARQILDVLKSHGYKPADDQAKDPLTQILDNVPKSLVGPLTDDGSVLGVIFIAVAFGIALRRSRERPVVKLNDLVEIAYQALLTVLQWVVYFVPLGVFCSVASIVGTKGIEPFKALGAFVLAVLLGLFLQAVYYLLRIWHKTWVHPLHLIRGTRDALLMAFSTGSSTATMPVTYNCLKDQVGLREESASLGALVGTNFNNDGTALYEAMSALFISQMLCAQGLAEPLTLTQQLIVVLMSIVASVGAAGIPEAGLVTMTLVFKAVRLPPSYISLLLTVDWFLDRSRTMINVMGDMNVSCLLDGKVRKDAAAPAVSVSGLPQAAPVPKTVETGQ
jgi:Na+/H+-dicarboxylate symporter